MRVLAVLFLYLMSFQTLLAQTNNVLINQNSPFVTCEGNLVTFTAVTGAQYTNYEWYNADTPSVILSVDTFLTLSNIPLSLTSYVLKLDSSGISIDDTIRAIALAKPNLELGPDTIICSGDTITLENQLSPPVGAAYLWNTGATSPTIQVSLGGTYVLRLTNFSGCFRRDTVFVSQSPALKLQDQGDFNVCQGKSLNVSAILDSGGISPYVFEWSPPGLFTNPNSQNTTLNATSSTTVSVKVTDRNGLGCTDSISFPVNIRPNVQASVAFSDSTICSGSSVDLLASGTSGSPGNTGYAFNWSGPNLANGNTNSPTASPGQNSSYLVIVSDSFNCDDSAFVNISIDSFGVNIGNGDSAFICSGEAVQISLNITGGDGNETFLWSPDNGAVSNINIAEPFIQGQGTFTIIAFSSNGCSDMDSVNVEIAGLPAFSFDSIDSEYCPSDMLTISGQGSFGSGGGYRYIYTDGTVQLNTDSSQVFSTQAGNFGLGIAVTLFGSVIDANNCQSFNDTLSFDVIDVPETNLTGDSIAFVELQANFTLSGAESADSIIWDLSLGETEIGTSTNSVIYTLEGNYSVTTDAFFGPCLSMDQLNVTVNPELTENIIYIPKAFSSNANDPENRTLKVYGENILAEDFSFEVLTAWGELIYKSTDLNEIRGLGWAPEGISASVLVVNINGKFIDGESFSIQQTVNFIQ